MAYKTFKQVLETDGAVFDASGIEGPEYYFWEQSNGSDVWYPVKRPITLPVYQRSTVEIVSKIEFYGPQQIKDILKRDPSLNDIDHGLREVLYETERTIYTDIEDGDGNLIFSHPGISLSERYDDLWKEVERLIRMKIIESDLTYSAEKAEKYIPCCHDRGILGFVISDDKLKIINTPNEFSEWNSGDFSLEEFCEIVDELYNLQ